MQQGKQEGMQQGMQRGLQEGLQQGLRQGLLEAIEMVVSLKFTHDAFKIMPLVYQIGDTSLLKTIKSAVMAAKDADELIGIIKSIG
jgi:flagellar biosynthesis/type III secretory pathway protein FliH